MRTAKENKADILKEYYVVREYKENAVNKTKIDSFALLMGRSRWSAKDLYVINIFTSTHSSKKDSLFFNDADSITIVKSRKNIANYFFKRGMFYEKQNIKNGKIMLPLYDSVSVKFDSPPVFKTY